VGYIIGWAIALGLIVGVNFLSYPIHDLFLNRARPPAAPSPRSAPYPVEVYHRAEVKSSSLEMVDDGLWEYNWTLTSPSAPDRVASFYREKYPQARFGAEGDYYGLEFTPPGAGEKEQVTIEIQGPEEGEPTTIHIDLRKQVAGAFVPSLFSIRLGLWALLAVGFVAGRRPLARLLGRLFVGAWMARGGSRFERLLTPPGDPRLLAAWKATGQALEGAGFSHAFDYTVTTAGTPNCCRLYQREGKTLALLQFVRVHGRPYHYLEFMTWFADGSVLTTSTSRYAAALQRPEKFPVNRLSEETEALEALRQHEAAVSARGSAVAAVEVDSIFEIFKQMEQEMYGSQSGKAGLLTREGLDLVTSRGGPQTPPPGRPPGPASEVPPPPVWPPRPAPPPDAEAAAPPPPAPAPPVDDRGAFGQEVAARLRQLNPDLTVGSKDPLTLTVSQGAHYEEIDLETVFYMCRNSPQDKDKILDNLLRRFAPKT
jgi:hypothetical protein